MTRAFVAALLVVVLVPAWGFDGVFQERAPGRPVTPEGLAALPALLPVMECAALAGLTLDDVTDAPVALWTATLTNDGETAPYCEVRGNIEPANTLLMRLPVDGWTQRYVQTGCGARCGYASINFPQGGDCAPVRAGTVASATSDMGHQGERDGSWAAYEPQAQIDFAYRAMHVTAEAAKAIITRFYGKAPAYSYFIGCSDGGREGLMEAQRFPDDFDGIVAGAPANNVVVQNFFHHGWGVRANRDSRGRYILLAGKLPLIHRAVVAACDELDGVADGVLDDPRLCDFDPGVLRCEPGQKRSRCLTAAEVGAVRRLHDGAVDEHGNRFEVPVAREWGSELGWRVFVPDRQGQSSYSERSALAYGRYLGRTNVVDPDWRLSELEFTTESFWDLVGSSAYLAANNPDLSDFRRSGGKLLLWHGWEDQFIAPRSTLAYYEAMRAAMGGAAVDKFAKLYMFPGVAHCTGGNGLATFDVLTPLMAWTESGREPGKITVSGGDDDVTSTRPVYPYPAVARHDGAGDPDDAASFVPVTPTPRPRSDYQWLGERLYSGDYQRWCEAADTRLVCAPAQTWLTRRELRLSSGS
ncbi:tannase/feruloyl esterase family alpha/beta hydrolase [Actinocorallia sp. API 0066]|uniref:tannase/feruloyl esterase family alpha/beta hydrolase n=1 Tax=Actinocorallia sp. API 0066 TaxID=2896846 RepID=UPI001E472903|nr:tannase/feruloyl esterase family alpha/beta hydrolase [Actinocorallia sp. API 0066]MCD0451539.1 tannase/feruloyl esterase family alpha/beta hydrolase [Actinocorallia sp. API 0066]